MPCAASTVAILAGTPRSVKVFIDIVRLLSCDDLHHVVPLEGVVGEDIDGCNRSPKEEIRHDLWGVVLRRKRVMNHSLS